MGHPKLSSIPSWRSIKLGKDDDDMMPRYNKRKSNLDRRSASLDGEVIPSDQAYADIILDREIDEAYISSRCTLESLFDKQTQGDGLGDEFTYQCTHTVLYKGEAVWKLKTISSCNRRGTRGQSSSCILKRQKGVVRVNVIHKGRHYHGGGRNVIEHREYSLIDIIRTSGQMREKEFLLHK
jgi:hypothetical protein